METMLRMSVVRNLRWTSCFRKTRNLNYVKCSVTNHPCYRYISTSDKSRDTATMEESTSEVQTRPPKNWMSFGYDVKDQDIDTNAAHSIMFFSVSLCMIIGGFLFAYMPDYQLRDWSQREAYLLLRYREQNGLPLIDPNYVDESKVELPTDEELGETEIVI